MQKLKTIRWIAWGGVLLLGALLLTLALGRWRADGQGQIAVRQEPTTAIGGPFVLQDHRGRTITDATLRGRPFLLFFGFASCPEVCPTTLSEITSLLQAAGAKGDRVQALFVSVDPGRDTPDLLSQYIAAFDSRIVAASGSKEQVDAIVAAYRATYRIVPTGSGAYTVDHTASVFMMDSQGRFVGTIDFHEDRASALAKLMRLAAL